MKPTHRTAFAAASLLALLGAAGCDDPLEKAQIISEMRVLGAKIEVLGDPTRAAPAPGETARVELFVAALEPAPVLGWTLSACLIEPGNTGIASCASAPFATGESSLPSQETPAFDFDVPSGFDATTAQTVAVRGRVCDGALAEGRGLDATCAGGAPGTALNFEFPLASGGISNENPSFGEAPVLLDTLPWVATPAACDAPEIPKLSAGSGGHAIELVAAPEAREPLPQKSTLDPLRESLLFAHFSDKVELERVFSSVTAEGANASASVGFQAPASAENAGELIRFWFVLRDLRGGSAFIERSLCVIP